MNTGKPPKNVTAGGTFVGSDRRLHTKTRQEMSAQFQNLTKEKGLYQISLDWKNSTRCFSHTFVVERLDDGKLMVFDPQRGAHYKWREYIKHISANSGIEILPLRELMLSDEYGGVLEKSTS